MDIDEYKTANVHVVMIANTIEMMPLDEMIDLQSRSEALAPLFDPTAFMHHAKALHIDKERCCILREAQAKLKKLRAEHAAPASLERIVHMP